MIAIERVDGGVAIMHLVEGDVQAEVNKWKAAHAGEYVSHFEVATLPDRALRDAWVVSGGAVVVDPARAKTATNAKIDAQIVEMEKAQQLARVTREYMIADFAAKAAAINADPMLLPGYKKLHDFDASIAALRASRV
jgi:hypothetical protein